MFSYHIARLASLFRFVEEAVGVGDEGGHVNRRLKVADAYAAAHSAFVREKVGNAFEKNVEPLFKLALRKI